MNVEFKQNLSEKDFKKAIAIHYFGFKYTYINPAIGVVLLVIFIALNLKFGFLFEPSFLVLVAVALFLIARPWLYVQNVYKSSKTNKTLHKEAIFQFTDEDKIVAIVGENQSTFSLKDLYAFSNKKTLILLYISKTQYFIIDKKAIDEQKQEMITNKMKELGIKKK